MPRYAVILPAAGRSERFRDPAYKKPFAPLAGRAVWLHAAERFLSRPDVRQVIVVIAEEDRDEFQMKFGANLAFLGVKVCVGGAERADSIAAALKLLDAEIEFVAVHDAARPCLTDAAVDDVFAAAANSGAAILAVPVAATLKRVVPDSAPPTIAETVDRRGLWEAQTPQAFRRDWLEAAYAGRTEQAPTDDAALVERLGHAVTLVEGSPLNIKLTAKNDLKLAEQILKVLPKPPAAGGAHPFGDDDLWR